MVFVGAFDVVAGSDVADKVVGGLVMKYIWEFVKYAMWLTVVYVMSYWFDWRFTASVVAALWAGGKRLVM